MRSSQAPASLLLLLCLLLTGCFSIRREAQRPGSTDLGSREVVLPALLVDNTLIVEAKWDRFGPYHFLLDTGSADTLVTRELAGRYGVAGALPPGSPEVQLQSSDGRTTVLAPAVLDRLELGRARFRNVPVLIYDCSALSGQYGVKIDGILGFPLFRKTLLTLDYPRRRVILRRPDPEGKPDPGASVSFNNASKTPLVPIRIADRTFIALVDSGSDQTLSVNPVGLGLHFASGPTEGRTVGTLAGDRIEAVARLADTIVIGDCPVPRPTVEVSDELSSLGGGILRYFTITFDQENDRVTFHRDSPDPILLPAERITGLSFSKSAPYWRVVGVVPGSPADAAEVEPGDLVTRINGEPVARWDVERFERLNRDAASIVFTFLNGASETSKRLNVVNQVP